jgi:hypothetical protein
MTIREFAQVIDIPLRIHGREVLTCEESGMNYLYVVFDLCDVLDEDGMLHGSFGNGNTVEEAVQNYAGEISGKILVHKALHADRRKFKVPQLGG